MHDINKAILQQFNPNTEVHILRSVDSVSEKDGMHHAYPAEFLQQLNAGGLPPALLSQGWLSSYLIEELGSRRRTL